jgi:hypothetical protein
MRLNKYSIAWGLIGVAAVLSYLYGWPVVKGWLQ